MMKKIFLVAMLSGVVFVGCNNTTEDLEGTAKSEKQENQEKTITDLEWLNRIIKVCEGNEDHIQVYQCTYQNNQTGYLIYSCVDCPDAGYSFCSSEGVVLCGGGGFSGEDNCQELGIEIQQIMYDLNFRGNTSPDRLSLYDKDSVTIQNYIQGKWNVIYAKGGFIGNSIDYFNDCSVEFTADKKYIAKGNGRMETFAYYWRKYTRGSTDSIYVMLPKNIFFDEIKNDTLIYQDAADDGRSYYLIRTNN